jgi:EAL domain-containing protein (putative c-di-GMP-specific phosphodiesterase class I)
MYQAKEKGRGRWHLFSPDDTGRERANARVIWGQRIVDALKENRFELHFQPILEIATGKIWRAEALIRMRDTDGKLVMPGSFIPIAEETHQIRTLDHWVLARAIELMQHHPELSLSVNLSANAVQDPSLPQEIERLLRTYKVSPSRLTLEVTETVAINSLAQATRLMHEILGIGCHFALDDFGSGFASYAYLRQLPVDDVKIDGAFIRDIAHSKEDKIFVRAVTEMAHGMGKKVIAEFVENADIVEVLAEIGVDYAQGYHIGRPQPPRVGPHRLHITDQVAV